MDRHEALKELRGALPPNPEDDHGWERAARVVIENEQGTPSDPIVDVPAWVLCPRCSSTRMRGHAAANEPAGYTCMDCGWVRLVDHWTGKLVDKPVQPVWHKSE